MQGGLAWAGGRTAHQDAGMCPQGGLWALCVWAACQRASSSVLPGHLACGPGGRTGAWTEEGGALAQVHRPPLTLSAFTAFLRNKTFVFYQRPPGCTLLSTLDLSGLGAHTHGSSLTLLQPLWTGHAISLPTGPLQL